ncbi:helix-hairpin-helix domain-containing protein [bacterium]|nr:MAG: helix-hairpin-helix domain-containing protein [bacterium]
MFFKKISEPLYRFFLLFGLTRQETYVVLLLAVLSVIGAAIPYVRTYVSAHEVKAQNESTPDSFKNLSERIFNDSALSRNEKDSLIALFNGDSVSFNRWSRQADSLKKLLALGAGRESIDSFFLQVQDAPVKQININEATAAELSGLPGVGEKIAERIVEYRNKKGHFRSVDDLKNVKGIGKKMFAKIKPFVEIQ